MSSGTGITYHDDGLGHCCVEELPMKNSVLKTAVLVIPGTLAPAIIGSHKTEAWFGGVAAGLFLFAIIPPRLSGVRFGVILVILAASYFAVKVSF
jgi:hypothetical protein